MKFMILKNGEWKEATKEDITEGIKESYGIDVDNLHKIKVCINGEWVSGDKLVKE